MPLNDLVLRRIWENFVKVASSQALITAFNLITLMLNARALGPDGLGILITIMSVSYILNKFGSFQTWQGMIRFGAEDIDQQNYQKLRKRFHLGLAMDMIAAILATLLALIIFSFFSEFIGLTEEQAMLAQLFALAGLFRAADTSVGTLRLLNRFGIVQLINTLGAALLLANALVLAYFQLPLPMYVYTIAVISTLPLMTQVLIAKRLVDQLDSANPSADNNVRIDFRSFLRFSLATSATGTLNSIRQRGEVILINALLGSTAAGLYGVAYRLASLSARFAEGGRQAVYPEIAALTARGESSRARAVVARTVQISALVGIPFFLAMVFFGEKALELIFGSEFREAYPIMLWLSASTVLYSTSFALGPYVQLVFGAGRALLLNALAFFFFCAGGIMGPTLIGLEGAGAGAAAFTFVLVVLLAQHCFGQVPPDPVIAGKTVVQGQDSTR